MNRAKKRLQIIFKIIGIISAAFLVVLFVLFIMLIDSNDEEIRSGNINPINWIFNSRN